MLATASLGAVWASCSPDFGIQGVLDRFAQIRPKVLLATDGYRFGGARIDILPSVRALTASLASLVKVVLVPDDPDSPGTLPGAVLWDDYLAQAGTGWPGFVRVPFDHPLFIMFTSGTTGLPKCLVHSVGGTLLQHLKEHRLHCDLGPQDRLFYFTTCGWMMWNWLASGLAAGAALVLYDGSPLWPKAALWDLAAMEKITVLGTSARWLAASRKFGLAPVRTHDLGALRTILSTGSPLAPESFDYVYTQVKADLQLSSISGGTDIISCFALGSPVLPVRRGELQCRGLGMQVEVFDPQGRSVKGVKGDLVCSANFPSMPVGFWNDPGGESYRRAYFARFAGVWCHGDFAELTPSGGMIIHGRSDTVLNPGGVRIGTAEITRIVDKFDQVQESLVIGQDRKGDVRILLFLVLKEGLDLTQDLMNDIKKRIREEGSPRHVPALILQAPAIPRTVSGKVVELAVRRILHGQPVDNADSLANPRSLDFFRSLAAELS
jgi:acetoacetyl-CoA synthetase